MLRYIGAGLVLTGCVLYAYRVGKQVGMVLMLRAIEQRDQEQLDTLMESVQQEARMN